MSDATITEMILTAINEYTEANGFRPTEINLTKYQLDMLKCEVRDRCSIPISDDDSGKVMFFRGIRINVVRNMAILA